MKISPYADEIKELRAALVAGQDAHAKAEKEKRYTCVLYCHRVSQQWCEFQNEFVERKFTYYIRESKFYSSMYYNDYTIKLTEDVTVAQMFEVEDAVAIAHSYPFEIKVQWREDNRKRCPKCDSLCESKLGKDSDLDYTCTKNPKHKVASFTLFSKKAET